MATSDRIESLVDGVLDRARSELRSSLDELVRTLAEEADAHHDEVARSARVEAEAAAAALVSGAIAAERGMAQERLAAAVAEAQATARAAHDEALGSAHDEHRTALAAVESRAENDLASAVAFARASERQAGLATAASLVDGIRALDDSRSLTDALDRLATHASRHAARVAVLLVRDGELRGWRSSGITGVVTEPRFPIAGDHLVSKAAATAAVQHGEHVAGADGPLAPEHEGRAAVAVPVVIDGRVVAVLYGDDDGSGEHVTPSAWPEVVEVLARHAGRCLEALTARRMPDLVRASAAERTRQRAAERDNSSAQRCARLLVAEIKLYHEPAVEEARSERDILRRLRPQIERARQLYTERVPAAVREHSDYFGQELLQTLAGGDATLLGQAP